MVAVGSDVVGDPDHTELRQGGDEIVRTALQKREFVGDPLQAAALAVLGNVFRAFGAGAPAEPESSVRNPFGYPNRDPLYRLHARPRIAWAYI
jgi:hypothetical protein